MESVVIIGGNSLALELIKIYKKKKYKVYYLVRKKKKINYFQILVNFNKVTEIIENLNKIRPSVVINLVSSLSDEVTVSFKTNIKLPIKLLNWVILNPKSRLVLIGSSAEYGLVKKKKVDEKNFLKPQNIYGLSKSIQSIYAKYHFLQYRTNFILLRLFNLKGRIFNKKLLVGKINNFIKINKKKKSTLLLGNLSSYRDYIDEKIVADYIFRLSKKKTKGEIINIGSGVPILVRDLVNTYFAKHKNLRYREISDKKNLSDPRYLYADIKKLERILK